MLADAEKGLFDMVVVKDISRFARNTVDLLQSVRKLKSLGIETQFLTANMTSMGNSEFVLTIFGALAQEESANTSKRIKFGKKMNAERGVFLTSSLVMIRRLVTILNFLSMRTRQKQFVGFFSGISRKAMADRRLRICSMNEVSRPSAVITGARTLFAES